MATRLSLLFAMSALAACNSGPVNAQRAEAPANAVSAAEPASRCNFSGWSSDADPHGLNVRAGPSATAPILGTLPSPELGQDIEVDFGVTFDVVESSNGWFRIENARRWSEQSGPSSLPSGWISGRYLAFQLQTDKVFAAPDPGSRVEVASRDEGGTLMQFRYRHPTDCRGEWVRLTVIGRDGREREGWVRGICGIQETTCDGVQGDLIEPGEARGWTAMD